MAAVLMKMGKQINAGKNRIPATGLEPVHLRQPKSKLQ